MIEITKNLFINILKNMFYILQIIYNIFNLKKYYLY